RDAGPRRTEELPWQLVRTERWQGLYDVLADLPFLAAAWNANQFEVKEYWSEAEKHLAPRGKEDAYRPVLDDPERHIDSVMRVAMLLESTGITEKALALWQHLAAHCAGVPDSRHMLG